MVRCRSSALRVNGTLISWANAAPVVRAWSSVTSDNEHRDPTHLELPVWEHDRGRASDWGLEPGDPLEVSFGGVERCIRSLDPHHEVAEILGRLAVLAEDPRPQPEIEAALFGLILDHRFRITLADGATSCTCRSRPVPLRG